VVDSAAVGAELGVRYVVDGGLQVQDDTMRINIALVDARTRLQVWADRFERDRSSRFAAQDEIARGLARALHVNVMAAEERRRPASVSDPGVNDLLAKAWFSMLRISDTGANPQTEKTFEEVLRRDPDNGSALLGLGGYHVTVAAMFLAPDAPSHIAKAETFLDRALRQNPNASLVHYFLGNLYKLQGRPEEALGAYTRVLELNPSFAPAYAQVGHVLSRIGRIGEAMEHVRYAMRLSPKDPSLGLWSLFAGEIELELGHDQAALDWLTRAIRTDPRSPFAHASLAAAMALRGDDSGAEREALQVENIAPWLTRDRMIARLTGLSEHGGEPRRLIEGLRKAFPRSG
jgi:tetratricopeptide (TPR) repeat protein